MCCKIASHVLFKASFLPRGSCSCLLRGSFSHMESVGGSPWEGGKGKPGPGTEPCECPAWDSRRGAQQHSPSGEVIARLLNWKKSESRGEERGGTRGSATWSGPLPSGPQAPHLCSDGAGPPLGSSNSHRNLSANAIIPSSLSVSTGPARKEAGVGAGALLRIPVPTSQLLQVPQGCRGLALQGLRALGSDQPGGPESTGAPGRQIACSV